MIDVIRSEKVGEFASFCAIAKPIFLPLKCWIRIKK